MESKTTKLSTMGSFFKWKKSKSKESIDGNFSKTQRSRSLDVESLHKSGLKEFLQRVNSLYVFMH